ncbi:L-xylulose reductase-like isoform X1 [Dermacentor albipictus]|uniref:L-xylulose reductase-like isoform X1 n=1 Tax=Dermacentor albipictus TaxID=60249 RepID=UPI0038FD0B3C
MEVSFSGKRAVVTGASQGIGNVIARELAKRGATVIAVARSAGKLEELKEQVPNIIPVCVDLADWNATEAALSNVGPIDLLVNNAAVAILEPVGEIKPESFDISFATNVKAVINVSQMRNSSKAYLRPVALFPISLVTLIIFSFCCALKDCCRAQLIVIGVLVLLKLCAKSMKERRVAGAIVNVSSQAGIAALANHAVYCASKAALDQLTRVMALELGPHKIRVNSVNPTVTNTPMSLVGWSDPLKASNMRSKIPLGRFAEPEEVCDAVLYLLSDHASMITGTVLPVDGGYTAC